jgi:hypothetical protein
MERPLTPNPLPPDDQGEGGFRRQLSPLPQGWGRGRRWGLAYGVGVADEATIASMNFGSKSSSSALLASAPGWS